MSAAERHQTAKLFMHGRSQAVRLPKEFRFEGNEVRVSRIGGKVILEPLERPVFDVKAWRASLNSYLDTPFPELAEEAPDTVDETISFD